MTPLRRAWLLLAALTLLMAATWPRDDAGVPAAQCSFIGSAGTPTLCATTDPLPTTTAGPTQSTTDPTGWGRNWFQATGLTNNAAYVVFAAEGQTIYAVERIAAACPSGTVRTFVSDNGGRTFSLRDTSVDSQTSGVNGSVRVSGATGTFLIAASDCGTGNRFGILRSQSGFQFVAATRPASGLCSAGSTCSFFSIAAQGNTVIASSTAPAARCRSTDGGTSFPSCASTAPTSNTFHSIASPTTNIWIAYDVGGDSVHRSTDDGLTWTNVLSAATGGAGRGVVECLSPTICLQAGGTTIRRSTNAGLTWTAEFAEPFNNNIAGLLSFGSGVAVAWSGAADRVYRTNDFGDTWNFQVIGPDIDFGFTTGDYAGGVTLNGRGVFAGTGRATTNGVAYSRIVGAGETIIADARGNRQEITPEGRAEVLAVLTDAAQAEIADVTAGLRLQVLALTNAGVNNKGCSTPAANTAATLSTAGVANQDIKLFSYIAFYDVAPAAPQVLTVTDAATTIWRDVVGGALTPTRQNFTAYLHATTGNTMTVTLPAGGAGVSGTLCATMSQYQP